MNKKIISTVILLILLISMAATYVAITQLNTEEQGSDFPESELSDDEISNEIDDAFLDENGEVDIGEMV